jgi:Peptidase family M48
MRKLQGCSVGLLVALLASGPGIASAEDLDYYSARIQTVTHSLVAAIRPTLAEPAQKILDDINFEAPLTWETSADARRTFGNRRVVEFNAGFLAVTDWLSLAMIADWAGHQGCLREYTDYLSTLVGHNSHRIFKGKGLHFVHDFASYSANTRGACEGALQDPAFDAREIEIRDQILDSIVATVLLHEIAHHVLDHVSEFGGNFLQRRLREVDADRWAINTAVTANYDLRTSVPLFLFLAATGGGTLEDEIRSSTHPSSLKRVRDLLVQTRALLDKKDPLGAHLMDASIDDLNRSLF